MGGSWCGEEEKDAVRRVVVVGNVESIVRVGGGGGGPEVTG